MNIGKLDARITIETPTIAAGELGDAVPTWSTLSRVWSEHRELVGRELVDAAQRVAEVETKFIIRYSSEVSGVNAKCRIVRGATYFDILAAMPMPAGRPDRIEIFAKRRAD